MREWLTAGEETSKTLLFRRCGCHQQDVLKLEASSCGTRPLSFRCVRLCHNDLLPGGADAQMSRAQQWGLSGRVLPHSRAEGAGQLIGCAIRPMLPQTSRKAFCYFRNAVLHNERITWAGFLAKVIQRLAFWTSPSIRSLTIVTPGQFRPSVISTITGGLFIGLY